MTMRARKIPIRSGQRFGQLKATGRSDFARGANGKIKFYRNSVRVANGKIKFYRTRRRAIEVICRHGNKQFVGLADLRAGKTRSCRNWKQCTVFLPGKRFGTLTTTGKNKWTKRPANPAHFIHYAEVICPHKTVKYVRAAELRCGAAHNCKAWGCVIPGTKFGQLIATGRTDLREHGRYAEVQCPHGFKKFSWLATLRNGTTTSCLQWSKCVQFRASSKDRQEHRYLREHTPKISLKYLVKIQHNVCPICGGVRSGPLDSLEHLIPLMRVIKWKMSLGRKQEIVNHPFNLFAAHKWCNNSRNDTSLKSYWGRNQAFAQGGRQAFANLIFHYRPKGDADMN